MLVTLALGSLIVPDAAPTGADLSYFQGAWTCEGHFVPSMKPVASTMVFSVDPETGATIKHLADKPPGAYRATETWAFSKPAAMFRATISDPYSGLRWYASAGWKADVLTWDRASGVGEPSEEFIYRRLADGRMQVDWKIARSGQPLVLGDTLVCSKA